MEKNQYTKDKEKRKKFRVVLQIIILLGVVFLIVNAVFTFKKYKPYDDNPGSAGRKGFVALSYFGVDRVGTQSLIGQDLLRQHLAILQDRGYVTITQQDILDYYQKGKKLPVKSLFLMFEDGRRDTAIFAQDILENLNDKATMCTYPEKFEKQDTKFLMPAELKELEKNTFWEMGTNGYRLYFINVFDRYNNYLGNMDPLEHSMIAPVLGRKYNHYLMDYIRDEIGYPLESYQVMRHRIDYDYTKLKDVYSKELGYVPGLYVLMHSNTGSFGNNDKVSAVNGYWMHKLFKMNFNREGYSLNNHECNIYDLTRMQPQSYWPVNHLLTRINDDTSQKLAFADGDKERHDKWITLQGAAEMRPEKIILTTTAKGKGLLQLKDSKNYKDIHLTVNLRGNKFGTQNIYLRASDNLASYVSVGIVNNFLIITDNSMGQKHELLKYNLDRIDGIPEKSIDEDKQEVVEKELETFARYAQSASMGKIYVDKLKSKAQEEPTTVAGGAKLYQPVLSYHARGNRKLTIDLSGQNLKVLVDGKEVGQPYNLEAANPGAVYLEADWAGYGWSQINLADDVYDGIFQKLVIKNIAKEEKVLYDDSLKGLGYVKFRAKQVLEVVVDWVIQHI